MTDWEEKFQIASLVLGQTRSILILTVLQRLNSTHFTAYQKPTVRREATRYDLQVNIVKLGGRILAAEQNTTSLHQSAQSNSAYYTGAYMQKQPLNDSKYYKHLKGVGNG